MRNRFIIILSVLSIFSKIVFSQENPAPLPDIRSSASNLPDISVIGDFAGSVTDNKNSASEKGFLVKELEFAFQGYLYPEVRADIFFALHRHGGTLEPELCEASVSFLKLVDGLSLKTGKIHVDFGKINKIHQHERPYVDQPVVITNFLGAHGLVGEGADLSYLLPLPVFVQLAVGAWQIPAHEHEPEEVSVAGLTDSNGNTIDEILVPGECGDEFGFGNEAATARIWSSFSLGNMSELEFGVSGAKGNGSHYSHHQDEAEVSGADITLKIWPSTFKRIIFQNEFLKLKRTVPVGELNRQGFYSYLGYQLNKYWETGLRYDSSENAFPVIEKTNSVSLVITNKLTETTKIRLQYARNLETDINTGYLQLVFGIGPHTHPLQ